MNRPTSMGKFIKKIVFYVCKKHGCDSKYVFLYVAADQKSFSYLIKQGSINIATMDISKIPQDFEEITEDII